MRKSVHVFWVYCVVPIRKLKAHLDCQYRCAITAFSDIWYVVYTELWMIYVLITKEHNFKFSKKRKMGKSKTKAWKQQVNYSTNCQNEVPKAHPLGTTWQKSKTDFFLLNLVLYLFCLHPVASEPLISILLKSCFNSIVSVVLGGTERTLRTTRSMHSYRDMNQHIHILKGFGRIAWANSNPWGGSTAAQQQLMQLEPEHLSPGAGQWPQTADFLLQNATCKKLHLKVLG